MGDGISLARAVGSLYVLVIGGLPCSYKKKLTTVGNFSSLFDRLRYYKSHYSSLRWVRRRLRNGCGGWLYPLVFSIPVCAQSDDHRQKLVRMWHHHDHAGQLVRLFDEI